MWTTFMFGNSAHAFGYANAAILIELMKRLISDGTITKDEAAEILDGATKLLTGIRGGVSIDDAVKVIRNDMKPRIAA